MAIVVATFRHIVKIYSSFLMITTQRVVIGVIFPTVNSCIRPNFFGLPLAFVPVRNGAYVGQPRCSHFVCTCGGCCSSWGGRCTGGYGIKPSGCQPPTTTPERPCDECIVQKAEMIFFNILRYILRVLRGRAPVRDLWKSLPNCNAKLFKQQHHTAPTQAFPQAHGVVLAQGKAGG